MPEVSAANRERARKMIRDEPDEARKLLEFKFRDPQRMARELEVFLETGRPLGEWQKLPRVGAVCPMAKKVLIMPPKEILQVRIRERLSEMIEDGGLDEARRFIDYPDRAIGIEEIGKFLRGDATLDAAVNRWAERTDQYAKRQRTWFRNQFAADMMVPRVPTEEDLKLAIDN
jgi:tRNA dimethylallyltransferase